MLVRRRRPNASEMVERTVDIFSTKEFKRRSLAVTLGNKKSTKDLRAKSIASTLERVRMSSLPNACSWSRSR